MAIPVYFEMWLEKESDDSNSMAMTNVKLCFTCAVKEVIKGNNVDAWASADKIYEDEHEDPKCERCKL